MTRISFLVPTYNRAKYIAESLQAILPQAGPDDEVLVLDDGSSDETEQVVRGFGSSVRYKRQQNAGKAVALNHALAITDGAFVCICDDDDLLRPGGVNLLLHELTTSNAGYVFGRHSRFLDRGNRRQDIGTGYWPDLSSGSILRHVLEDAFMMQNATLVRRTSYHLVGAFDEALLRSQDYEMFVRLALAVPGRYVDAVIFDQRKHDGQRGPRAALHGAVDADHVWSSYDRRIFSRLHEVTPISLYASLFRQPDGAPCLRAGHLQRGVVNARHNLWDKAVSDFQAAAKLDRGRPLDAGEYEICRRALAGKHGFAGAQDPCILSRLAALAAEGHVGWQIRQAIISGVLWHFRVPDRQERRRAVEMVSALGAWPDLSSLLLKRFVRQRQRRLAQVREQGEHERWAA